MKNHKLQNAIDDLKSQIDSSTKKTKFDKIVEFVEKNKEFIKIGSEQFETIHKAGDFKEEEKSRFHQIDRGKRFFERMPFAVAVDAGLLQGTVGAE